MHSKDARAAGETEQRLYLLNAWREAPMYSDRERAALAWTEALTRIGDGHAPDNVYEEAREHFDEKELVDLTLAIVTINGWNRLAIGFAPRQASTSRRPPLDRPGRRTEAAFIEPVMTKLLGYRRGARRARASSPQ